MKYFVVRNADDTYSWYSQRNNGIRLDQSTLFYDTAAAAQIDIDALKKWSSTAPVYLTWLSEEASVAAKPITESFNFVTISPTPRPK